MRDNSGVKTATMAQRISERIEHLYLNRETVAGHVGVTAASVWNWASGTSNPQSSSLVKLAEVLECSVGYLLCTTDKIDG